MATDTATPVAAAGLPEEAGGGAPAAPTPESIPERPASPEESELGDPILALDDEAFVTHQRSQDLVVATFERTWPKAYAEAERRALERRKDEDELAQTLGEAEDEEDTGKKQRIHGKALEHIKRVGEKRRLEVVQDLVRIIGAQPELAGKRAELALLASEPTALLNESFRALRAETIARTLQTPQGKRAVSEEARRQIKEQRAAAPPGAEPPGGSAGKGGGPSYAERLKRGERPSPDEVDALTAKYLSA